MKVARRVILAIAASHLMSGLAYGDEAAPAPASPATATLTAAQMFVFADQARAAGDYARAEAAYRALAGNPDLELRTEARFRLAMMMADQLHRYRDAAVLLRQILDEKPKAARVRLELARMQAQMGNLASAERELRAAEAGGLPPEVERMVRFYANSLGAAKPFGLSLELAIAPDSNINRATRSDTLGTVIGDFTLDQNAKARSGIGLSLRSQAYWRHGLYQSASLLVRVSGSTDLYRDSAYDDFILGVQAGPEYRSGRDRITLTGGPAWRWYGTDPYSVSLSGNASLRHPVGGRSQLSLSGSIGRVTNRRNALQSAHSYALSAGGDHAFSERLGGGVQIGASREVATDPGYSTASGNISAYAFHELGRTTMVLTLGYGHLEADQRLLLYPRRRVEDRYSTSLGATFRALRLGGFAPLARLKFERNVSTIELYNYKRIAGEVGLSAAF